MVVFSVRQDRTNEYLVPVVVDRSDQAVLVASDIEHRQTVHVVGTGKRRSQVVEICEALAFHRAIPRLQRTFSVWMCRPEVDKGRLGDDVHDELYTKKVYFQHNVYCTSLDLLLTSLGRCSLQEPCPLDCPMESFRGCWFSGLSPRLPHPSAQRIDLQNSTAKAILWADIFEKVTR